MVNQAIVPPKTYKNENEKMKTFDDKDRKILFTDAVGSHFFSGFEYKYIKKFIKLPNFFDE